MSSERIDPTLTALQEYWQARPHLRLGQIVVNAWRMHTDYKRNPEPEVSDIFYLTDAKFREGLLNLIGNESKGTSVTEE